jgi:hypothetical protein
MFFTHQNLKPILINFFKYKSSDISFTVDQQIFQKFILNKSIKDKSIKQSSQIINRSINFLLLLICPLTDNFASHFEIN